MVALAGYQQNLVVVGGGIVGASISWHLQAQGANVTVVAEDIGGTATPNSFAWINAAYGNPKFYFDLRHRSMGHWRELGGGGDGGGGELLPTVAAMSAGPPTTHHRTPIHARCSLPGIALVASQTASRTVYIHGPE